MWRFWTLAAACGLITIAGCKEEAQEASKEPVAASAPESSEEEPQAATGDTDLMEFSWSFHTDFELPEQDAYIEREPGSDEVWRVTKADQDMDAPLFTTAEVVPYDPTDADALGPHPKGEELGITLGEWYAAEGSGTYQCKDGVGTLETEFKNLVPEGLYTMWHAFEADPPTEPYTGALELPIGARDGSETIFHADADGNAEFKGEFKPCLQLTSEYTMSMLAIALHSDGETYGGDPGDFGKNTHVQMLWVMPPRADLAE